MVTKTNQVVGLDEMASFGVASYNIQYSLGADRRYDLKRCIDAVRDADIICLQEIDRNWRRTNMADQFAEVQAMLPDRYCAFGPSLDVNASVKTSDGFVENRRRQSGQMTVSRFPIASSRSIQLPKDDTKDAMNSWCAALETVILTPDNPVRVVNLHLTDVSESNRVSQISALLGICERATTEGGAWNGKEWDEASREHWQLNDPVPPMPAEMILAGDFNDESDSRTIDIMRRAQFRDTWRPGPNAGAGVTFKTNPEQGTYRDMRIDFIFVSPQFKIVDSSIDESTGASDHQPVWSTLRI
jgi:endonuclease/exonuclease/phosphatase family metal-dependent hydrolase